MARLSVNGRQFDFTAPKVTFYDAVWLAVGQVRHPENYTVAYCRSNMGGPASPRRNSRVS